MKVTGLLVLEVKVTVLPALKAKVAVPTPTLLVLPVVVLAVMVQALALQVVLAATDPVAAPQASSDLVKLEVKARLAAMARPVVDARRHRVDLMVPHRSPFVLVVRPKRSNTSMHMHSQVAKALRIC